MKTVLKKIVSVVLVSATVLSLAACSKKSAKALSADEFKNKMEAEGYTVMEGGEEDGATITSAVNEAGTVSISHMKFADSNAAKEAFDQSKKTMDVLKDLAKQEGQDIDISTSSSSITFNSEDGYTNIVLAGDTIVSSNAEPGTDGNISAAKSAMKALGY